MANTFESVGQTQLTWSLSDDDGVSRERELRLDRSLVNGTAAGQANVAYTTTLSVTGAGSSLNGASLWSPVLGVDATTFFSDVKELIVSVTSGPTGGWVRFGAPTGAAGATGVQGIAIRVGGQLHLVDHVNGFTVGSGGSSTAFDFIPGTTGTYTVEFQAIGIGGIVSYCP